jgi:hypothetical protein
MNKLLICKKTREIAADTLKTSLEKLLSKNKPISEIGFASAWLLELRRHKEIFPDGWYIPPPSGIAVLFGRDDEFSRINFTSVRPENYWPRKDVLLDLNNGIIMAYASPVDKKTGIIGDFEMTIYFGKNPQIIDHFKKNLQIVNELFSFAQIGMTLSDIATKGHKIIKGKGLSNSIFSINDSTSTNIGHTIPFSYESRTGSEFKVFKNGTWENICLMISKKREFLNNIAEFKIRPGMAFTIEPRLKSSNNSKLPLSSFHAIALFHKNGEKELLTNFDKIFRLAGMDYMLNF